MQSNTRVGKPPSDSNVFLTRKNFSQSGMLDKVEIIIEHRASSGDPFTPSSGGFATALNLFQPSENAKRDRMAWAYFKACVLGFALSMIFASFFVDSNAPSAFTSRLFLNLASGMVMLTMAPFMVIPIRILSDIFRFFSVKRGLSDVLIGTLCGSVMMLPDIASGDPIRSASVCFILGGAAGGFAFWRYRGYPQTGDRQEMSGEPSPVVQRF